MMLGYGRTQFYSMRLETEQTFSNITYAQSRTHVDHSENIKTGFKNKLKPRLASGTSFCDREDAQVPPPRYRVDARE